MRRKNYKGRCEKRVLGKSTEVCRFYEELQTLYLCGGTVTVAYNPEDVSCIWLLENGAYIRFELIESRYRNKNLEEVESIKTGQKAVIKAFTKEQTQAQVDLVNHIEMIAFQTDYKGQTRIKGIRENRRKEQIKTHKDYVKEGV